MPDITELMTAMERLIAEMPKTEEAKPMNNYDLELEMQQLNEKLQGANLVLQRIIESGRLRVNSYDLEVEAQRLGDRLDTACAALQRIAEWGRAYPPTAFPEPDWSKAAMILEAGGMSVDSISASCMRHVVAGVAAIATKALEEVVASST